MSGLRLSETLIQAADDSLTGAVINQFEESGTERSVADESQHAIVDMLDRALSGEEPLSEISESDGELLETESNISSSSRTSEVHHRRHRRSHQNNNNRRKSSFGGDMRSDMLTSIRKHRMDPEALAILLRKYYEQDKELRRLEADLQDIDLPLDFDSLSQDEAMDKLMELMEEVQQLQDQLPEKSARNHQSDLDQVLLILKNEYNKMDSLTSTPTIASQMSASPAIGSTPAVDARLTTEQETLVESARRVRARIHEIECLKEQLRQKLDEVTILEHLPEPNIRPATTAVARADH